MGAPARSKSKGEVAAVTRDAIVEQFAQLVLQIPEAPEGDITDIVGPLLQATTLQDFNRPDKLPSSKDLAGVPLRYEDARRVPSDNASLTGYYLRCIGTRLDTGEMITWTAGGEQSVAFQARLYVLNLLPAYIKYETVPTRSGNDAVNCKLIDAADRRVIEG